MIIIYYIINISNYILISRKRFISFSNIICLYICGEKVVLEVIFFHKKFEYI